MMDFNDFFNETSSSVSIDYSLLNKAQLEAVNTTEGPVLVIAGAGSGKTKVLIYRLAKLIEMGVSPSQILLLTFTNKAAKEMINRANALLDERVKDVTASTYHSFCVKILRKYAHFIGISPNFSILNPSNCAEALNLLKTRLGLEKNKDIPQGKILASIFSFSTNKDMDVYDVLEVKYPKYLGEYENISALQEEYARYKKSNNLMDYDDMLTLVNELFTTRPDVCKYYSDRFRYIMVDEYQDSNNLQMEFLSLLRKWGNDNLCVVGDDFQAIYSFRGSNFKNILKFPRQFKNTKVIKLTTNYRSNQEILDLANALMANAPEKYDKELVGVKQKDSLPKIIRTNDVEVEAKYIFYKIWEYHSNGVPFKDIAVLVRNAQDSVPLELLIQTQTSLRHVPFQKFGGTKFLDKEICQDILAFLSILTNPNCEIFWFRVFQLYQNIGPAYAAKLVSGINSEGLKYLVNPTHKNKKYGKCLPEIFDEYMKMKEIPSLQDLLKYLINDYYPKIKKRAIEESNIGAKSQKITKGDLLTKLDEDVEEAQALITMSEGFTSINAFLEALLLDNAEETEEDDKLTISTVHSAKGLEFKVVFLVDCVDCSYPGERPLQSFSSAALKEHKEDIEESRRLLYVAATRAKDDLYIMWPKMVKKFGRIEFSPISRFIEEDGIYLDYCDTEYI